ncbi:hypothetical protein LZ554_001059 [Drepanopeziza brunnea f. sp. 'monogermtubi']|nr:hypothetical protein LZ554_001059 [Drepanopeziza brunnea f. sp. 'monogermtubi']
MPCRRLSAASFPSISGAPVSYAGSCLLARSFISCSPSYTSTEERNPRAERSVDVTANAGQYPYIPSWTGGALAPETYPSPLVRRARKGQRDAGSDILQSCILGVSTRLGRTTPNWPVQPRASTSLLSSGVK